MTSQQIYDKVKKHLLKQGCKSENAITCLYRGQNGTKCAVGVLITNEMYSTELEGGSAAYHDNPLLADVDLLLESVLAQLGITDTILASNLQSIHDRDSVRDWERRLTEVAYQHGLRP